MNVLWFSNTPALGEHFLNKNFKIKGTGGWMQALNQGLKNKIDLSVVFHYPYSIRPFYFNDTHYYPVFTGNIILQNLKKRILPFERGDKYIDQYLKIIKEVKPDIIHIHGTENSYLSIIDIVDIPIVVSIQGNLTIYNHKYLSGFHGKYLNYKEHLSSIKGILLGRNSFIKEYKLMGKRAINEQKRMISIPNIIGRTDWDYRISRILAPCSNYFKAEELLREGFYKNQWNNPYRKGKVILFTTNGDNYYKGFETAVHALTLLQSIGIDIEWRIAGVSESNLINKITKKHLKDFYPKSGLKLMGPLPEEILINNMLNAHRYVMPSQIENSPNNLCEAMILGMPCVATFAGGTGSILKDGEDGILIQDGDPWVMAGAIIELINSPEKSLFYSNAARMKALKRHDVSNTVNQYLATYSKIIEDWKQ